MLRLPLFFFPHGVPKGSGLRRALHPEASTKTSPSLRSQRREAAERLDPAPPPNSPTRPPESLYVWVTEPRAWGPAVLNRALGSSDSGNRAPASNDPTVSHFFLSNQPIEAHHSTPGLFRRWRRAPAPV